MSVRLKAGDQAPDFTVELAHGGTLSLHDLSGAPAILWFYPAANTPLCTRQACDLRDNFEDLSASGARIIGISPDSREVVEAFVDQQSLPYDMAADPSLAALKAFGAWGEKNMYGTIKEGVIRSTFVLNERGVIVAAKYRVGTPRHIDFLRASLQTLDS